MTNRLKLIKGRTPRQERSRQMVEWILEAAMRLFSEKGYDATTTNKIADMAGVSIGSLYHYFPNKDSILLELGVRHRKMAYHDILSILKNSMNPDLREVLKEVIIKIFTLHRDNRLFIEAITMHTHVDKQLDTMERDCDLEFWTTVGNVIQKKYLRNNPSISIEQLRQAWIILGKTGKDVIHNMAIESVYGHDEKAVDGMVDAILSYMYHQSLSHPKQL